MNKVKEINSLALAYLGDSIYEVYIREYLLSLGIMKVNELQKMLPNMLVLEVNINI